MYLPEADVEGETLGKIAVVGDHVVLDARHGRRVEGRLVTVNDDEVVLASTESWTVHIVPLAQVDAASVVIASEERWATLQAGELTTPFDVARLPDDLREALEHFDSRSGTEAAALDGWSFPPGQTPPGELEQVLELASSSDGTWTRTRLLAYAAFLQHQDQIALSMLRSITVEGLQPTDYANQVLLFTRRRNLSSAANCARALFIADPTSVGLGRPVFDLMLRAAMTSRRDDIFLRAVPSQLGHFIAPETQIAFLQGLALLAARLGDGEEAARLWVTSQTTTEARVASWSRVEQRRSQLEDRGLAPSEPRAAGRLTTSGLRRGRIESWHGTFGFVLDDESRRTRFFHLSAVADPALADQLSNGRYEDAHVAFELRSSGTPGDWTAHGLVGVAVEEPQAPAGVDAAAIHRYVVNADRAYERGEYAEAARICAKGLREHPDCEPLRDRHERYQRFASKPPTYPVGTEAWQQAMRAEQVEEDLDRARRLFELAVKRRENHPTSVKQLIALLMRREVADQAAVIEVLDDRMLRSVRGRDAVWMRVMRAQAHSRLKQHEQAVELLTDALRDRTLSPEERGRLEWSRAVAWLHGGRFDDAEGFFRSQPGDNVAARRMLARALIGLGRRPEARAVVNEVLERLPDDAQAQQLLEQIDGRPSTDTAPQDGGRQDSGMSERARSLVEYLVDPEQRARVRAELADRLGRSPAEVTDAFDVFGSLELTSSDGTAALALAHALGGWHEDGEGDEDVRKEIILLMHLLLQHGYRVLAEQPWSEAGEWESSTRIAMALERLVATDYIEAVADGERAGDEATLRTELREHARRQFVRLLTDRDVSSDRWGEALWQAITDTPDRQRGPYRYLLYVASRTRGGQELLALTRPFLPGIGVDDASQQEQAYREALRAARAEVAALPGAPSESLTRVVLDQLGTAAMSCRKAAPSDLDRQRADVLNSAVRSLAEAWEDGTHFAIERASTVYARLTDLVETTIRRAPTGYSVTVLLPVIELVRAYAMREEQTAVGERSTVELELPTRAASVVDGKLALPLLMRNARGNGVVDGITVDATLVSDEGDRGADEPFTPLATCYRQVSNASIPPVHEAYVDLSFTLPEPSAIVEGQRLRLIVNASFKRGARTRRLPDSHRLEDELRIEPARHVEINPYDATNVVDDERMLFGREQVLRQLQDDFTRRSSGTGVILYGLMRSGKTSVAYHLESRLDRAQSHLVVRFGNLYQHTPQEGDPEVNYLKLLEIIADEALDRLARATGTVPPPQLQELVAGIPSSRSPVPDVKRALTEIRAQLGGRRLLLVLDEFTKLASVVRSGLVSPRFIEVWKPLITEGVLDVLLIGHGGMPALRAEYNNDLNVFTPRHLSFLGRDEALRLIREPVSVGGVSPYLEGAAEYLYELTCGHPHYVQLLCHEVTQRLMVSGRTTVAKHDVVAAANALLDERGLDDLFRPLVHHNDDSRDDQWPRQLEQVCRRIATEAGGEILASQLERTFHGQPWYPDAITALKQMDVVEQRNTYYRLRLAWFQAALTSHYGEDWLSPGAFNRGFATFPIAATGAGA